MCRWQVKAGDVEVVHEVLAKHHQYLTSRPLLRLLGLQLLPLHRLVQLVVMEVRLTSRGLGHTILQHSKGKESRFSSSSGKKPRASSSRGFQSHDHLGQGQIRVAQGKHGGP